jgi:hypothetical protein
MFVMTGWEPVLDENLYYGCADTKAGVAVYNPKN